MSVFEECSVTPSRISNMEIEDGDDGRKVEAKGGIRRVVGCRVDKWERGIGSAISLVDTYATGIRLTFLAVGKLLVSDSARRGRSRGSNGTSCHAEIGRLRSSQRAHSIKKSAPKAVAQGALNQKVKTRMV